MNKHLKAIITLSLLSILAITGCVKQIIHQNDNSSEVIDEVSSFTAPTKKIPTPILKDTQNMDDNKTVFEMMNDLKVNQISMDDESNINKELFFDLFKELDGIWYSKELIDRINNQEYFGDYKYALSFDYNNREKKFNWFVLNGWDAVGGEFNKVKKMDTPNQYIISYDDTDLDITLSIAKNRIESVMKEGDIYIKLETTIEDYINNKIIVGSYKDTDGEIYKFTEEKKAEWPDRSFTYQLFNWDFWDDCNPLCVIDDSRGQIEEYFGYKIVKNVLCIYKVIPGQPFGFTREEEPMIVLEREKTE